VPEDLGSFYRQQLKWARGVYEVAFSELPRLFPRLTWRQRLCHLTIGTYYLCGATTLLYLVFPYLYLWTGVQPASMRFEAFVTSVAPVGLVGVGSYLFSQRWLCDAASERGLHWRGVMLKIACWPVFLTGTVLAVFRADVPYVPTAKQAARGRFLRLAWPQLALVGLFGVTLAHVVRTRLLTTDVSLAVLPEAVWGMVAFAALPVIASLGALHAAWQSRRAPAGSPWDEIDVHTLGGAS
jgi:cellulose synthase (UDP-forming)